MDEVDPARGEVWWVDLDPTRGSETCKTRPAVVVIEVDDHQFYG